MRASRNGVVEIFTRPHQHIIVRIGGALVRLRAELTVIAVLLTGQLLLTKAGMSARWALVTLLVIVGVLLAIPATRRYLNARSWAVTSRHRVRTCFVQTRTMTYDGKMPYLLWSRPSPVGERIRVWLPAGLSVKDIDDVADKLAAACWAREARVHRRSEQAATVFVEIIRRDPLSASDTFRPDVVDTLPEPVTSDGTVIPLPLREDIADVPENLTPEPTPIRRGQVHQRTRPNQGTRRGTGKDATNKEIETHENTPAVVGLDGMDVSDYV
ncbi:MAG: hypothetical protein M3443_06185 [Actinomycetota bacterium]|nr:hypothetical protein [Actinomycetota bacterium]